MSAGIITGAILAAGSATRLGGVCKALVRVDGEPAITRLLRLFLTCCDEVLVGVRPEEGQPIREAVSGIEVGGRVRWIVGGSDRNETIANLAREAHTPRLLIHDVARATLDAESLDGLLRADRAGTATCLGVPCGERDAVGLVVDGVLTAELPKKQVYRLQTPVLADTAVVLDSLRVAAASGIPESLGLAHLLRATGVSVRVVEAIAAREKLTLPRDLRVPGISLPPT